MIDCKGIIKRFDSRVVLNGVDLRLDAGRVIALMGPNGSGKTTLLRAAALIEPPDAGTIVIDDHIYSCPLTAVRPKPWPRLSVVFQDLLLWPHLTIRDNIAYPCRLRFPGTADNIVDDLVARLSLDELLGRYPNQLSRGERQLVAIARALALRPRYLFLDEISASLDLQHIAQLSTTLRAIASEGAAVLLVTHQLGFTRHTADRLLYLSNGTLFDEGDIAAVDDPRGEAFRSYLALVKRTS